MNSFAEDAVVEDPVGGSPLDPEGTGLQGRAALEGFWDMTVEPSDVTFTIDRVHAGGDEAVVVASVNVVFANGARVEYDGAFFYRVDAAGKIASLRAFWDLGAVVAALSEAPAT